MPELNEYIPVQIVFDNGLKLATAGVVSARRQDGCYEIVFPQSYCIMTINGKPRNKWPKADSDKAVIQYSPVRDSSLQISQPLMPRRKRAKNDGTSVQ